MWPAVVLAAPPISDGGRFMADDVSDTEDDTAPPVEDVPVATGGVEVDED